MATLTVGYTDDRRDALERLSRDPSLAHEFDVFATPGSVGDLLADPFGGRDLIRLAFVDDAPAGFAFTYVLPGAHGPWAMTRVGVRAPFRRRGLGSRLLAESRSALAARPAREGAPLDELCLSAWVPSETAEGFAARHGYAHARTFWRMERPRGAPAPLSWPQGITVRVFDGSERALREWNAAYLDAFADHYHFVATGLEEARGLVRASHFRPDGLALAYRGERCVGFCRNALFGTRGEIAVLGVVREARGIGLGRALLRWGVAWLERTEVEHVDLLVDGENPTALALYRSEGFAVVRTRASWSRRLSDAGDR